MGHSQLMKNPKISVILPFRNASNTLRRAIDSILNQTFRNFELILINDGSDDHPIDILSDYDDPRIKIIHLPTSGIVFSLNHGVHISRGKYIARMDADDYLLPGTIGITAAIFNTTQKHRSSLRPDQLCRRSEKRTRVMHYMLTGSIHL